MPVTLTRRRVLLSVAAVLFAGTACAGGQARSDDSRTALGSCSPNRMQTVTTGSLTLSTGVVTRAPWVVGGDSRRSGDPRGGKGYDAAVGYALAERLGYRTDDVTWVGTPFAQAVAEGQKRFDVNINQATITPARADAVDLSRPYYTMRQAVVSLKDRPTARARTLADLRDVSFAAVAGSQAAHVLTTQVDLTRPLQGYADLDAVRGAVTSGTQQALVADYTAAVRFDGDETVLVDGTVVGVLPRVDEGSEAYGLVLEKGSPLTACVNAALLSLRRDGTLRRLEQRWLLDELGYRELR